MGRKMAADVTTSYKIKLPYIEVGQLGWKPDVTAGKQRTICL